LIAQWHNFSNVPAAALSLACQFGHTELVQALLDAGADIGTCDMKPKVATPLMAAAYEGHVDVVRTLIARGADVERLSPNGNNALDRALAEGREDAAKVLLEAMAGPNYPKDSVALQLALADTHAAIKGVMNTASIMYSYMEYGRHDEYAWMMWVLRQGGEVLKRAAMRKMLHAAMMDRNLSMLGALLDQGCDVDVHLASGHTCLSFAVGRRDIELINILLRAGADPNKPIPDADDHSYTPFDRAVIKLKDGHDTEIVDLLLATGRCRINKGRDVESTAFSYVLGKLKDWGSDVVDKLAQRMIDSVANIEEDRDDNGGTLLHVAVHHQRAYFVDYICWKGLHIDVAGAAGYTPFIQACQHSPKMALELILRGASINTKYRSNASALHAAATKDHADLLLRLLGLGLDIEECTLKGFTPLACALKWGREQAALALLSCGARTDWVTPDTKHSPLHYAARHGLEKVTNYLLHNSSSQCRDPNALDAEGWSPLHEVRLLSLPLLGARCVENVRHWQV
jgi:ankyrin repeat protein